MIYRGDFVEEKDNVVVLTDEDGVEREFEIVTDLEVDGNQYYVLYPTDSKDDEDAIVLKLTENENGEDMLAEIEDDDEFNKVEEAYNKWADENEEYGEYDDDDDTDDGSDDDEK